jgi:hypothetical protein
MPGARRRRRCPVRRRRRRAATCADLTLDTDPGALDVLLAPDGAPPYDQLRARALTIEVSGRAVRVAAPEDLLAMKRAAGRPKDLADIEELEAILRLRR